MPTKISRRNLFRLRLGDIVELMNEKEDAPDAGDKRHIRPPGAISDEKTFLDTCSRCNACVEACPHDIIKTLTASAGSAENTPILTPETDPCRWCEDMPCINACQTDALSLNDDGEAPPIGKAVMHRDRCLNEQGIICDTCSLYCPTAIKAIRMKGREVAFDPDICVGCGMCAYFCDSQPSSFSIILPNDDPKLT